MSIKPVGLMLALIFAVVALAPRAQAQAQSQVSPVDAVELIQQIELQFNKYGVRFDPNIDRRTIADHMTKLYDYFNSENDPGASKRMTYLLGIFKYAEFRRITGAQLRQLSADINTVLTGQQLSATDISSSAKVSGAIFDIDQIMNVTDYFEMTKTPQSVLLTFHTNCKKDSCQILLNLGALPASAKSRMLENGVVLENHLEYKKIITFEIISDEQVRMNTDALRNLIISKSYKHLHEMTPEAPRYVDSNYTNALTYINSKGQSARMSVVEIEKQINQYVNRILMGSAEMTLMPIVLNVTGLALAAQWDKRQAGALGFLFDTTRLVQIRTYAVLPQLLNATNPYSPVIFSAVNKVWKGIAEFTIKIAR